MERRAKPGNGFTLIEILVVLGILGLLMGVLAVSFGGTTAKAQKAKCHNLVEQTATILAAIYDVNDGLWPTALAKNSNSEQGLDEYASYPLAKKGMSLTMDSGSKKTVGLDRYGVVSPWAMDVIKKSKSRDPGTGKAVPSGGTIADHRFRYALCGENGYVEGANVGGESVDIRTVAAVWCCGADGKIEPYSEGLKRDDVYSWDRGKANAVK